MPNYRERPYGDRPDEFRIGARSVADSGAAAVPRADVLGDALGGVLVEEAPGIRAEELLLRREWQLALRIAASKGFCKSNLLQKFLLYVCEQQLTGNGHEITEQRIGTQIFHRTTDYNPGEDNIVRSYARLLRKRLEKYFEEEGSEEPLRLLIPRGGYVPAFLLRSGVQEPVSRLSRPDAEGMTHLGVDSDEAEDAREIVAAEVRHIPSRARWKPAWLSISMGLLVGALLASAGWIGTRMLQARRAQEPAHLVWMELFQRDHTTLIVPADSGLGILQNLTGQLVPLEEYANGTYLSDVKPPPGLGLENLNDLRHQRYTSVVDLNITARLAQLPESAESRSQIRYARSITTEDLKSSNAILLGSTHTNPWVSLFEKKLNFKLEYLPEVDRSFVLNEHPVGTEQNRYVNGTGSANHTYGVIDYLPGLDGTGHVLIIQGLNMAATQAAADTLFNWEEMKPILKQVVRPDRSLKSFELLVETSSIGATAPEAQIIATRFYP